MPIYNNHKLIHIHIPKTAGVSISNLISKEGIENGIHTLYGSINGNTSKFLTGSECTILQHIFWNEIKSSYPIQWYVYKKFAFVRNPYDRIVSIYSYLKHLVNCGVNGHPFMKSPSQKFDDFVELIEIEMQNNFVKFSHNIVCHFYKQTDFICGINGAIMIDFVGKFENIEEDIKWLYQYLKVEKIDILPFLNKTEHQNYMDYYNSKTKKIIYKLYESDFKKFDYAK